MEGRDFENRGDLKICMESQKKKIIALKSIAAEEDEGHYIPK